jgi:hypothetical protein
LEQAVFSIKKFLGLDKYISALDKFLDGYRKSHPKLSTSQRLEKAKFDHLFRLRDNANTSTKQADFWDKF